MDKDLFLAFLVLETKLVESFVPLRRVTLDRGHRLVLRQLIRRHVKWVIYTARDHWLIRISVNKMDDDLHADARNKHRAPLFSSPRLCDRQPARIHTIGLALAVPIEVDLDTTVFVSEYFLIT